MSKVLSAYILMLEGIGRLVYFILTGVFFLLLIYFLYSSDAIPFCLMSLYSFPSSSFV